MNIKQVILNITILTTLLSATTVMAARETDAPMTFFVTSTSQGGNLGGLAGADATCQKLAAAVGAGDRTWRAYLSTQGTNIEVAVNARDRIGKGPWHNVKGVLIAANIADLHGDIHRDSNLIVLETALTEKEELVTGRDHRKGAANEHDILTGSDTHGRAFPAGVSIRYNLACNNWTDNSAKGSAMVGHHDRASSWNTSWNSSHASKGCSLEDFKKTGGSGRFYCFASDGS